MAPHTTKRVHDLIATINRVSYQLDREEGRGTTFSNHKIRYHRPENVRIPSIRFWWYYRIRRAQRRALLYSCCCDLCSPHPIRANHGYLPIRAECDGSRLEFHAYDAMDLAKWCAAGFAAFPELKTLEQFVAWTDLRDWVQRIDDIAIAHHRGKLTDLFDVHTATKCLSEIFFDGQITPRHVRVTWGRIPPGLPPGTVAFCRPPNYFGPSKILIDPSFLKDKSDAFTLLERLVHEMVHVFFHQFACWP